MSNHDQCPSTTKGEKHLPGREELAALPRAAGAAASIAGAKVWRSPEEFADTPEFRDWLEREFPAGASELDRAELDDASDQNGGATRRQFLGLMGASLALAGAATIPGCRRPDHKILPYSQSVPEEIIPGKALYYATSMPRPDGGAEGLLVETHDGRPTKIEGNPLHPNNQGRCSTWALASILGLYDPERLKQPAFRKIAGGEAVPASYADFRAWSGPHFAQHDADKGAGLAVVVEKNGSPTRAAVLADLKARFPSATVVHWAPMHSSAAVEGARIAFGKAVRPVYNFGKETTRTIVSLDADFLTRCSDELPNARGFAESRRVLKTSDPMSRLYVVESGFSLTGAQADHRMRLAPSRIAAFAVLLAKRVLASGLSAPAAKAVATALEGVQVAEGADIDRAFLDALAEELLLAENLGRSVVIAGPTQPAWVHALAHAMNAALGNDAPGKGVAYAELSESEAADCHAQLMDLVGKMNSGAVKTLLCIGANPAYDAPGAADFGAAMAKVPVTITHSVQSSETAAASTWALNGAHYLECWGDTRAINGLIAPVQPMIKPLYEPAWSEIELLAFLAQRDVEARIDGYEITRAKWRALLTGKPGGGAAFESTWRRALHDGVVPGTGAAPQSHPCDYAKVAAAAGAGKVGAVPTQAAMEAAFVVGQVFDGRYANHSWLQELPDNGTRVVWDNPVLMSPATAEALGVSPVGFKKDNPSRMYTAPTYPTARMVEIEIDGRKVKGPAWILPGMADNTLLLTAGYGRTAAGRVADGVGFSVYPVLPVGGAHAAAAVKVTKTGGEHMIASTQNHWSMESRTTIVRSFDLPAFRKHGDKVENRVDSFYQTAGGLNFAERAGELSHTPPNESIYSNPFNRSRTEPDATPRPEKPDHRGLPTPAPYSVGPQWGMTIDQSTCTGCGACTVACQAENNIPVVGKIETAKGREMTWIRVDRYFEGDDINNPDVMHHQPVACVHCENAPCETVCPVNATVHGPEGLNYMTYNRCIGTRYCANNCPYKVRRFNFFDYGVTKFNGDYMGKETIEGLAPDRGGITGSGTHNKINPNLIPPRLRQKLEEIERMGKNPNVSVRSRGVMEKCSYCVQRINAARIELKVKDLYGREGQPAMPDGFFKTACEQACPSDAIVFGDILDPKSRVSAMRANARSYALLGYLNVRPRTSHMARIRNPNPKLRTPVEDPFHEHHHHHDHDHGSGDGHKHSNLYIRREPGAEGGRRLSLRVLSGESAPGHGLATGGLA